MATKRTTQASAKKKAGARVRPLRVRAGVRYECQGSGLCCTDIHAIGELSRPEAAQLKVVDDRVVQYSDAVEGYVMAMNDEGRCFFLGDDGLCALHEPMGGLLKPVACGRFPLAVVATPAGGRVTTEHRCPCRTMGERPELTVERALPSLTNARGQLRTGFRVERVPLTKRSRVGFARYAEREEAPLREAIRTAKDPAEAFGVEPFGALTGEGVTWARIATGMVEIEGDTRADEARRWFGDAIRAFHGSRAGRRKRPWEDAFERMEARNPEPAATPTEMYRDWLEDSVWNLYWTRYCTFAQLRKELVTRLWVARHIERRLRRKRLRPDRAAAEAIFVVDLIGTSDWWEPVAHRFVEA
ncbi:MAG: YkgJ family cysteine cluster protein [Myxococcota bacterium]